MSANRQRDYIAQSTPKAAYTRDNASESSYIPSNGSTVQSEVFMYVADSDIYVPSYEYHLSTSVAEIAVGTTSFAEPSTK